MELSKPKIKLISASAGTGKTYTLIQEISKVLEITAPKKVVAITFTRAATRDIRGKVHEKFVNSDIKDLDDLSINTIHGFFTGILREQSLYFKHSTNFNILEDFDDKSLFSDIAKGLLLTKVSDPVFEKFFAEYDLENVVEMLQKLESSYSTVRNKLKTDIKDLIEEERHAEYEKFKKLFPIDFKEAVAGPIVSFKGDEKDKVELIRQTVAPMVTKLVPATDLHSFYNAVSILRSIPKCSPGSSGSAKYWNAEELTKVKAALKALNELRKEVTETYRMGEEWIAKEAAKNRKIFFELFLQVHAAYVQKKKELDVLSYNDIELLTYDLVTKHPKVAEFYKEKYDYIFVDEFQDTNLMQKDVLFSIANNLFLVGDAKQSIYRFRNADVRVFIDTQKQCAKDELQELKQNRRCLPNIINSVNNAFPKIFTDDYLAFEPFRDQGKGLVRFINAPAENDHHNSFNHKLEAQICFDIIDKGVNSGKSYKDFAMLFRSSGHMVEFERVFREKGIPFVVYGGGSRNDLTESLKSLFTVILDPYNDYSMLEVLKQPNFYMSDEELYKLKKEKNSIWESLDEHPVKRFILDMRNKKDHGSFTEFVAEVLKVSKFIPSASLVFTGQEEGAAEAILKAAQHVESQGAGIEYFLEFISSMKEEAVGKEIDAVKLMTVHASKGLEFNTVLLPCLDVSPKPAKQSIVISEDGDVAVKLGDDDSNKKFNTVLYHDIKEREVTADVTESKRVFYVAMTRAMDELYLISDFGKAKGLGGNRWVDWVAEIFKDEISNYEIETKDIAPKLRRKVIRTVPVDVKTPEQRKLFKRWTVSQIKEALTKVEEYESFGEIGVGSLVHSALEHWHDKETVHDVSSVKAIVDNFAASDIGSKILSAKDFLTEYSFAVKIDGHIISGRIDRINIYDDHVWIIDYKTGLKQEELEAYKAQVACYLYFAEAKFKGKKVKGSLVDVVECKEYVVDASSRNQVLGTLSL